MLWELSESDLKRIEETASCAISIHSSFLTMRILNQAANAAAKLKGSIFDILYRRYVPGLGRNQTIGILAHKLCRLVWKILHRGIRYEERGPEVKKASKQKRFRRCRTFGEATGGPGIDSELSARCRAAFVADGNAQEVSVEVRSGAVAEPSGGSTRRGTH